MNNPFGIDILTVIKNKDVETMEQINKMQMEPITHLFKTYFRIVSFDSTLWNIKNRFLKTLVTAFYGTIYITLTLYFITYYFI